MKPSVASARAPRGERPGAAQAMTLEQAVAYALEETPDADIA